jgi:outer membrane biosynthesis protein TonB
MTDSRMAAGLDRLPWLSDEPKPRPQAGGGRDLLGWVVAAILLVAGVSYWIGLKSAERDALAERPAPVAEPTMRVPLPQPRAPEPVQPQVEAEPMPAVEPVRPPPLPVVKPRQAEPEPKAKAPLNTETPKTDTPVPAQAETADAPPKPARKTAAAKADPLRPWPVRVVDGASGRLVWVGTFSSSRQAKKGWWAIVRANPSLKRLPAMAVPVQSRRDGRTYYRLQMGTTSQAHSEVLCQRMRMIGQSCVVIEIYNRGSAAASQ